MKAILYILALPYLIYQSRFTFGFEWSKVSPHYRRPLKWWAFKALAEFYYWQKNNPKYYKYLDKCIKAGFNLYGEPLKIQR